MVLLSILIPTLPERSEQLNKLLAIIEPQLTNEVEVILDSRAKLDVSIGLKREALYHRARGIYSVQIDDDDTIPEFYVKEILEAIKQNPDCIGYKEHCTINGEFNDSIISISNKRWYSINKTHFRTPHFKTPILTNICRKVGVKDMRFGEDHDFAVRIFPLLIKEVFIPLQMYYYTANSLTPQQKKERYGL